MMKYADIADAIKNTVSARQVAESLGLNPNQAGFCKCPIHGEKTGSMKIYPGSRGWYCFGCHRGGDVIDLVREYYGIGFMDAARMLNDDFQLGLPIDRPATKQQEEDARRRAAEREREQREREARQKEQNAAYERYCDLGQQINRMELDKAEKAPKSPDDEWDPDFVQALSKLAELREEAEDAAMVCITKEDK